MGAEIGKRKLSESELEELRMKYGIQNDDFVLFYMRDLHSFAGLIEIVNFLTTKKMDFDPNLKFLIVGNKGIFDDLRDYGKEIEVLIRL